MAGVVRNEIPAGVQHANIYASSFPIKLNPPYEDGNSAWAVDNGVTRRGVDEREQKGGNALLRWNHYPFNPLDVAVSGERNTTYGQWR
jgi:hypothetical protein